MTTGPRATHSYGWQRDTAAVAVTPYTVAVTPDAATVHPSGMLVAVKQMITPRGR